MKKSDTTRIQIELPEASFNRLKKLKELTEASSYAEVTKNAFRIYERIIELAENGNQILLKNKDGEIKQLELFY